MVNSLSDRLPPPLFWAASHGQTEAVRFLLENGALIDMKMDDGIPLYAAACSGRVDVFQLLLERGGLAVADDKTKALTICLILAASKPGSIDLVKLLIRDGACPDSRTLVSELSTPLHAAANSGNREVLTYLIELEVEIDQKDFQGFTPLHRAVDSDCEDILKIEITKMLLKKGALINTRADTGCSPLHSAAYRGDAQVVKYLLEMGAEIEAKNDASYPAASCGPYHIAGCTPLHYAAHGGNAAAVKYLLEMGAEINALNDAGCTPLHCAAEFGHLEALECLVNKGACLDKGDHDGTTPLHLAASYEFASLVDVLIQAGAKINANTTNSYLPIHGQDGSKEHWGFASHKGVNSYLTKVLLIRAHADLLSMNARGYSALDCLRPRLLQHLPAGVVRRYFENRTVYVTQGIFLEDDTNESIFQVAANFLDLPVLTVFKDIFQAQLIAWRDEQGRSLLMVALANQDKAGVIWLLNSKAYDIHARDSGGHNTLWHAVESDNLELVNRILAAGGIPTFELVECAIRKRDYRIMVLLLMKLRCGYPLFR